MFMIAANSNNLTPSQRNGQAKNYTKSNFFNPTEILDHQKTFKRIPDHT